MTKDAEHREEEGSYLVSVSDLMIGLLFVFLLMLMAFALNYRTEQEQEEHTFRTRIGELDRSRSDLSREAEKLKQERDRLRDDKQQLEKERNSLRDQLAHERARVVASLTGEIDRVSSELQRAQQARARLLLTLRDRLIGEGIKVQVDLGSGILRLPDAVLFNTLSATLTETPAGEGRYAPREIVHRLAAALADSIPCYAQSEQRPQQCPAGAAPVLEAIFVEGHTDKRQVQKKSEFCDSYEAFSGFCDNYELSTFRALSTYKALLKDQPTLRDLRNPAGERLFGLSGYGPDRPLTAGDTESDLAANRRIDIRFLLAAPPSGQLEELRRSVERLLQAPAP